ncbi:MAG: sugar transferase [Sodalinema sp.]|uniref:Npun_R2821/Npun_R2822 family protein n=1 Tax=Sodalinema sp. TaxID=3080550 RepID=UPI0012216457|nr:MAG: sugar transferase [Phormidium sp. SL48-SHIP]
MNGICSLGNDVVFDQLVALLNSIDEVLGAQTPVCIYPFDDRTERIAAEIAKRPNVTLYGDRQSIERWDRFMQNAAPERLNKEKFRLYGAHRRFCAFDGPFDRFIYMDADTLAMSPLDHVFQKLDDHDWVVYDFQFKNASKIYNLDAPKLYDIFSQERIQTEVFCSGFFGAKRGLFDEPLREQLLNHLKSGDYQCLYRGAGEQPLLNYMVMRSGISSYNFANQLPTEQRTGCSATSRHFEEENHILYDKGNRLTYIHYIGVQPSTIEKVCQGENLDFPYRDLFLYYRYLHEPEQRPVFKEPPTSTKTSSSPNLAQRLMRKLTSFRS